MSRTGENIHKRKDGRWEARILIDHHYHSIYAHSYKEVKEKKKNYTFVSYSTDTFETISTSYLSFVKNKVKITTYARYSYLINSYLLPYFKKSTISSITISTLQEYAHHLLCNGSKRRGDGLSNKTVLDILTIIKNVLLYYQHNYDTSYHIPLIPYPKLPKQNIKIFTKQDIVTLLSSIHSSNKPFTIGIVLSLYCGLRIGEVCALKWKDIDLVNNTIFIHSNMQRITIQNKSTVLLETPKTSSSTRLIPIPSCILSYLKERMTNEDAYVISGTNQYCEPRAYYFKYKRLLRNSNIHDYNYHALRHSFATKCVDNNIDIKSLSEILGHANINTTLRIYVHPTLEMKRREMNKISYF